MGGGGVCSSVRAAEWGAVQLILSAKVRNGRCVPQIERLCPFSPLLSLQDSVLCGDVALQKGLLSVLMATVSERRQVFCHAPRVKELARPQQHRASHSVKVRAWVPVSEDMLSYF